MVTGIPESIEHAHEVAALKAMGIDPSVTYRVVWDATDGVTVFAFAADSDGNKLAHGDDAVRVEVRPERT